MTPFVAGAKKKASGGLAARKKKKEMEDASALDGRNFLYKLLVTDTSEEELVLLLH